MEISNFFKILKKHLVGIITIPILVMAITALIVKNNKDVYSSKSRLSAGLIHEATNESQQTVLNKENAQEVTVNQEFTNLLQTMKLRIVFDQVSYQLMLHDLTSDEPFKKPSKLLKQVNPDARRHAIEVYTRLYNSREPLNLNDKDQRGLYQVLGSMGYDDGSLKDKIWVNRVENSDFIDVNYESENPALSSFVVNTFCKEFISYYSSISNQNEANAIKFLADLLEKKKDSLDKKTDDLRNYKIKNGVLNLNEQAKSLYARVADFETKLEVAEKEVEANAGAIRDIDSKFNPSDQNYIESKMVAINKEITDIKEQLSALNDKYIRSNLDPAIKAKIDSLKEVLSQKINQSTDKYIVSPLSSKQNLINEKLKLEIDMELARNSIQSYQNVIAAQRRKLDLLVPSEAVIQSYESDIAVASQEYSELLKKYNQANMEFNSSVRIKQIEMAAPGDKQPSKKALLILISGVASFAVYVLVLFVLFYFDESIKVAADLFNKTNIKVLGFLPLIKSSFLDIQKLWSLDDANNEIKKLVRTARTDIQKLQGTAPVSPSNAEFKKLIRATRFEINMALMGGRNLVITSLTGEEGKTLVSLSLVSAYQMTNKKILLVDGNFLHPSISEIAHPKCYIEDYLIGKTSLEQLVEEGNITVLGNYGSDISLFEINSESEIEQKMLELKDAFDIIIIEASALDTLNQSKEWIVVADRVLCVFEANTTIKNEKKEQIQYLSSLQGKFIGWILNKVSGENEPAPGKKVTLTSRLSGYLNGGRRTN